MDITDHGANQKMMLLGITITALICALSISIPVFGFIFFLVVPLPALYFRIRLGTKKAAMVAGCSFILLVILSGGLSPDLFFIAGMLLLGFSTGEFIEKDLAVEKTIGYATARVISIGAFCLLLYANLSNLGLIQLISDYIGKNLTLTLALYENMGMPEENIALLSDSMEQIRYVLVRILPAVITVCLMLSAWMNLLLAKIVFRMEIQAHQTIDQLNKWKPPDLLVWGVAGSALMLLLPGNFFKILGLNGMIVLTIIYFLQGIAIISFFFEKKNVPLAIRGFLYATIVIQQILIFAIAGIGFLDIWLNFRKLGETDTDKQAPLSS